MRMLKVELKRIMKSRLTIILMIVGICLSALLAVAPVFFVSANVYDSNGNVQELNGISAIRYWRNIKESSDGDVTPEKLKEALTTYQELVNQYGNPDSESFPRDFASSREILLFVSVTIATLINTSP